MSEVRGSEVRKCGTCGDSAVVIVRSLQHKTMGMKTNSTTQEYRCQSCGAVPKLRSTRSVSGFMILGVITIPLVIPSIIFFTLVVLAMREEKNHPLVEGVTLPEIRYGAERNGRICANCNTLADLMTVKRSVINGIYSGEDRKYLCPNCKAEFTIETLWSIIMTLLSSSLFIILGFIAFRLGDAIWLKYVLAGILVFVGVLFIYAGIGNGLERFRNKKIPYPNPETSQLS